MFGDANECSALLLLLLRKATPRQFGVTAEDNSPCSDGGQLLHECAIRLEGDGGMTAGCVVCDCKGLVAVSGTNEKKNEKERFRFLSGLALLVARNDKEDCNCMAPCVSRNGDDQDREMIATPRFSHFRNIFFLVCAKMCDLHVMKKYRGYANLPPPLIT